MNNKDYIHQLTDKFMEGETTLKEEQELYRYEEPSTTDRHEDGHTALVHLVVRWTSVAAAVLLLFLGGTAVYRSQNYSEVIVYGHKSNDAALLHHEMASTMQQLDMQPENSVKAQLDDVLLGQD